MKAEAGPIGQGCAGMEGGPFLSRNLEALAKKNPELALKLKNTTLSPGIEILYSKPGLPVIRVGRVTLHSLIDPEKEARNWAARVEVPAPYQKDVEVLLFGFAMGYHVKALLDSRCPSLSILEPRPDVLRAAFEWADFSEYVGRIGWIADFEDLPAGRSLHLLRHQPSVRLHRDLFAGWERKLALTSRETFGDLRGRFEGQREIAEFLGGFPAGDPANLGAIAEKILRDGALPKDWQVIFLLMKEFQDRWASS